MGKKVEEKKERVFTTDIRVHNNLYRITEYTHGYSISRRTDKSTAEEPQWSTGANFHSTITNCLRWIIDDFVHKSKNRELKDVITHYDTIINSIEDTMGVKFVRGGEEYERVR